MEINEAIIIFIIGLVFGFGSAKLLINWGMDQAIDRIKNLVKEKDNEDLK